MDLVLKLLFPAKFNLLSFFMLFYEFQVLILCYLTYRSVIAKGRKEISIMYLGFYSITIIVLNLGIIALTYQNISECVKEINTLLVAHNILFVFLTVTAWLMKTYITLKKSIKSHKRNRGVEE